MYEDEDSIRLEHTCCLYDRDCGCLFFSKPGRTSANPRAREANHRGRTTETASATTRADSVGPQRANQRDRGCEETDGSGSCRSKVHGSTSRASGGARTRAEATTRRQG